MEAIQVLAESEAPARRGRLPVPPAPERTAPAPDPTGVPVGPAPEFPLLPGHDLRAEEAPEHCEEPGQYRLFRRRRDPEAELRPPGVTPQDAAWYPLREHGSEVEGPIHALDTSYLHEVAPNGRGVKGRSMRHPKRVRRPDPAYRALCASSLWAAILLLCLGGMVGAPADADRTVRGGTPARVSERRPRAMRAGEGARPSFDGQIRPILARNCFACHGPDDQQRRANLRLDLRADAIAPRSGRTPAVVPGRPGASSLIHRIHARNAGQMPPPASGKSLSEGEKQLLERWIGAGADYAPHWAFVAPKAPSMPVVRRRSWARNGVDAFILARLESIGLAPSAEADRRTLLRRVTLDLTGLPPTPSETADFLRDSAPDAYGKAVDRLLASPRFGERWATGWLDVARYADTNGYQVDRDREMWPWRDWVIRALNADMPFDQFTREQLAGDLLPNPTREQRLATGFHRNHMLNEEGGIIPEEFLVEGVADRTETTAAVWMGLTLGCARCHDHKFDPFSQKEYYRLYAFFNTVAEIGVGNYGGPPKLSAPPLLRLSTPEQDRQLTLLNQQIAEQEERLDAAPGLGTEQKKSAQTELERLRKVRTDLTLAIPTAMVMEEMTPGKTPGRTTHVLLRGQYQRKGTAVDPGTPAALPSFPPGRPKNRLGLADWLLDPGHPLTARVAVNRVWQALFGAGLVRTSEDFGVQGERPSHPELLDWLATAFAGRAGGRAGQTEGERIHADGAGSAPDRPASSFAVPRSPLALNWSTKRLIRLLVTSATYRQTSRPAPSLRERDPENRWLAHGPRLRLPAEMIRDQALFAGGLLVERLGGSPVRPYQPPGLYEQVAASNPTYVQGKGDELYRRSLYTYWRRSAPHPAMLAFDAPFRETCTVRRARTSTPLQALNLLNDPTYVEAARGLAGRMLREGGATPESRIALGYQLLLARDPRPAESALLAATVRRMLVEFRTDPAAAEALLKVGETPVGPGVDRAELAAYTVTAGTLLNLDETITRE